MRTTPGWDPARLVAAVAGVLLVGVCLVLSPLPWLTPGWFGAVLLLVAFDDGGSET